MTYGAENWIINKQNGSKITATKMEFKRRSGRLTRMDKNRNEEIRRGLNLGQ